MKPWESFLEQQDTSIEAIHYLPGLASMESRDKVQQIKAHLNVMQNPKNLIYNDVKGEKGCRLARGKLWMGQAEQSIQHVRGLTELKQVWDWDSWEKQWSR